ncbi:MAG TPA: hypothetical protein VGK58_20540 [Lacipirellulaceae bacterium]
MRTLQTLVTALLPLSSAVLVHANPPSVTSIETVFTGFATELRADDGVLVWDDGHIDAYDFQSREFHRIRTYNGSEDRGFLPDVSGRTVVWADRSGSPANIHLYDLDTLATRQITFGNEIKSFPTIEGGSVVWRQLSAGDSFDVFRATAPDFVPVAVANNPNAYEGDHEVSGNRILYAYAEGSPFLPGYRSIRVFDITTSSIIFERVVQFPGVSSPPRARIEGNIIMWTDSSSPDQTHIVNIETGEELFTRPDIAEIDISETHAVYWDYQLDTIFAFDFESKTTRPLVSGVDQIERNGLVIDGNRLTWSERAGNIWSIRSAVIIPEPSAILLCASAVLFIGHRRRMAATRRVER